jgi:hypothetical protein
MSTTNTVSLITIYLLYLKGLFYSKKYEISHQILDTAWLHKKRCDDQQVLFRQEA